MKKTYAFILLFCLAATGFGAWYYFLRHRPMNAEQFTRFVQVYSSDSADDSQSLQRRTIPDRERSSFAVFAQSLPSAKPDICRPVTTGEVAMMDLPGDDYWRRSGEDVRRLWDSYVDRQGSVPFFSEGDAGIYYSKVYDTFFFPDGGSAGAVVLDYGYLCADKAVIYTGRQKITLKKYDEGWKLLSVESGEEHPHITDKMKRLDGDRLWDMRQQTQIDMTLDDGYRDKDRYILFAGDKRFYLQKQQDNFETAANVSLQTGWPKNIFSDEGKFLYLQYAINENFLPADEAQSRQYNRAVSAYNRFMAGKAAENLETINNNDDRQMQICRLKDLSGDGIPELLVTKGTVHTKEVNSSKVPVIEQPDAIRPAEVYTFSGGNVSPLPGLMPLKIISGGCILENGMYYSHTRDNSEEYFVSYHPDGTVTADGFVFGRMNAHRQYSMQADGSLLMMKQDYYFKISSYSWKFDRLYKPFNRAKRRPDNIKYIYSPLQVRTDVKYSPYVLQEYGFDRQ